MPHINPCRFVLLLVCSHVNIRQDGDLLRIIIPYKELCKLLGEAYGLYLLGFTKGADIEEASKKMYTCNSGFQLIHMTVVICE